MEPAQPFDPQSSRPAGPGAGPPGAAPPPEAAAPEPAGPRTGRRAVPSTRTSASWAFLVIGVLSLVIVLVFILENLHSTNAVFFGAHWRIPLGVDLLLAALLGAVVTLIVGAARILQLRRLASRRTRHRPPEGGR